MAKPKHRLAIVAGLLALLGMASIVFALRSAKKQEVKERYAKFYEDFLSRQTNVKGPPLAKVLSADRGEPVANVIIGMTLIGPDGGDGGYLCIVTDKDGIAHNTPRALAAGRYQYQLMPDPKSRFDQTYWRRDQPYIVIADYGTTSVPTLHLEVDRDG